MLFKSYTDNIERSLPPQSIYTIQRRYARYCAEEREVVKCLYKFVNLVTVGNDYFPRQHK